MEEKTIANELIALLEYVKSRDVSMPLMISVMAFFIHENMAALSDVLAERKEEGENGSPSDPVS